MDALRGKYLKKFERGKKLIDLIGWRCLGGDDCNLVSVRPFGDETRPDLTRFALLVVSGHLARPADGDFRAGQTSACRHFNINRVRSGRGIEIARQSLLKKIERSALGCRVGVRQEPYRRRIPRRPPRPSASSYASVCRQRRYRGRQNVVSPER